MKSSVTLKERELIRDILASFLLHVKQRIDLLKPFKTLKNLL